MAGTYRSTDFLRGLAPGRFNRFSIGRYEKNREFFTFLLESLKAERCDFFFFWGGGGGESPRRWNSFETRFPLLSSYN